MVEVGDRLVEFFPSVAGFRPIRVISGITRIELDRMVDIRDCLFGILSFEPKPAAVGYAEASLGPSRMLSLRSARALSYSFFSNRAGHRDNGTPTHSYGSSSITRLASEIAFSGCFAFKNAALERLIIASVLFGLSRMAGS